MLRLGLSLQSASQRDKKWINSDILIFDVDTFFLEFKMEALTWSAHLTNERHNTYISPEAKTPKLRFRTMIGSEKV